MTETFSLNILRWLMRFPFLTLFTYSEARARAMQTMFKKYETPDVKLQTALVAKKDETGRKLFRYFLEISDPTTRLDVQCKYYDAKVAEQFFQNWTRTIIPDIGQTLLSYARQADLDWADPELSEKLNKYLAVLKETHSWPLDLVVKFSKDAHYALSLSLHTAGIMLFFGFCHNLEPAPEKAPSLAQKL